MDYFLTFDIGTTSVKTCVFDQSLRMRGHANGEYQLIAEKPGFVELVPETYFQAILGGAKQAIANAGIAAVDIVSISCSTQGETLIPISRNGASLRNAIVWLDERAAGQAARLGARFPAERFYRETGLPELNGYTRLQSFFAERERTGALCKHLEIPVAGGLYRLSSDGRVRH